MLARVLIWFISSTLFLSTSLSAEVIKSERDHREYRAITLDNGLRAVLVSDPKLDKAAAAMTVEVGSNANPVDRAGLAHFLEHMLFLGTDKYPEADSYQAFISSNGGSHNAFTAYENTTYFFDITQPQFEPALDRFSQFFLAPLFNSEYVDRERNAVHSEFEAKRMEDGRRFYVADKLVMNPEHAWTAFSVGDLDSLSNTESDPIREDLIQFFEQYYSANLMTLALVAPDNLDHLAQLANQYFGKIENRNAKAFEDQVPLYLIEQLPVQLEIKTLKATQQLQISFPIPPVRDHWRTKPLHYIANQLGYEGQGSLLSHLKEQGWAEALGAWVGIDLPGSARFDISIDLTAQGLIAYKEVIDAVFAEIQLMKAKGLKEILYAEQSQLAKADFIFSEPGEPAHDATRLSQMQMHYPEAELIRAPYLFESFDPSVIFNYLEEMVPERMILTLRNDQLDTDQVDQKYGIEYRVTEIDAADLKRWSAVPAIPALRIRDENPYVAQSFDIKAVTEISDKPQLLNDDPLIEIWHLQDSQFSLPKGAINIALLSPEANTSVRASVANSLLARMINEQLNESLYDAQLAGLGVSLYSHLRGISLKVGGYNDRILTLLEAALEGIRAPMTDQVLFERVRQSFQEEIENRSKATPYNQAFAAAYETLLSLGSDTERLELLKEIKLEDLVKQREVLLAQGQIRLLVHGNLSAADAMRVGELVKEKVAADMSFTSVPQLTANQLATSEHQKVKLNVDHNDSALILYLQAEDASYPSRAGVALINEILSAPFYSQLRTEQQLGYIVFSSYLPMAEQPGIALVSQSPSANSTQLKSAYLDFLTSWEEQLEGKLALDLDQYKASVRSRLMTPSQRLSEETDRLWREIDRENLDFDTRDKIVTALDSLTEEDVITQFRQLMTRQLWISSDRESE